MCVGRGTEETGGARVLRQHMLLGKMVEWLEPNEQEIVCQDNGRVDTPRCPRLSISPISRQERDLI